jgi:hypothetical protein
MFDRFDEERSVAQTRAPRSLKDVLKQGRDAGDLAVLLAHERNARTGLSRRKR